MKKTKSLFPLLLLPMMMNAQQGKVFDQLTLDSEILGMERKYAIYLPPGYEVSERSYPVLYLLHGGGDDQTGWVQFGEVMYIADKAINEGITTAMIIVMPDASQGRRGYFNSLQGDWRYEDFFFDEFIPFIEGMYRIKSEKRCRAIAGLSMGGGGAFAYALRHPELFSSACPLSANCGPVSMEDQGLYRWSLPGRTGNRRELSEEERKMIFEKRSVLHMIRNMPDEQINEVRWYIDCGDDDHLFYQSNSLLHIAMRDKEIPHEYRVRDGGHNWTYWRASLPEVLAFVSVSFHQK